MYCMYVVVFCQVLLYESNVQIQLRARRVLRSRRDSQDRQLQAMVRQLLQKAKRPVNSISQLFQHIGSILVIRIETQTLLIALNG